MSAETHHAAGTEPARARRLGLSVLVAALLPALAAIWSTPWFVTQDGPAHLYNAQIIARAGDPSSPFRGFYQVRWDPLPNWAGHLAMAGLLQVVPARAADRLMTSLTLVAFAASIAWLRWRIVGWRGMPGAALMAVILALNLPWLLGFTSFLLGACLYPITLGLWWQERERLGPRAVLALAASMVLGYFCHLVSLGLTVAGLVVLTLFAPGARRLPRIGWTALGLLPLVPLGAVYLALTRSGGGMHPVWTHLPNPWSLGSWKTQITWADPLSLAMRVVLPFRAQESARLTLLAPVVAFVLAMGLQGVSMARQRLTASPAWPDRRGWGVLAAVLILGGLAGPDTFGATHGNYLPQRILLFGLVALVPLLHLEPRGWAGSLSVAALAWAVLVQSAFVWEYAGTADRNVGALMKAAGAVGREQRVATLLAGIRGRFRANPLLHADNLLGVDTGNILWSNYETRHYYFPVQFLDHVDRPDAQDLEEIALLEGPEASDARAALWRDLLEAHEPSIDVIVAWGADDPLVRISEAWFVPVYEQANVRVLRHREHGRGGMPGGLASPRAPGEHGVLHRSRRGSLNAHADQSTRESGLGSGGGLGRVGAGEHGHARTRVRYADTR